LGTIIATSVLAFSNLTWLYVALGIMGLAPLMTYAFSLAGKNGFPENELREAIRSHPGREFGSEWIHEISVFQDGDEISRRGLLLQVRFHSGTQLGEDLPV